MNTPTQTNLEKQPWLIIDVESLGLHGEGFAVAGAVFVGGVMEQGTSFVIACNHEEATPSCAARMGDDLEWVEGNVAIPLDATILASPDNVRRAFWLRWLDLKKKYANLLMAGECLWPVEARFLIDCVDQKPEQRNWEGPYPFHEIATFMLAAGFNPMETWERLPEELPAHDPMADVRLSARVLHTCITTIVSRR